MSKYGITQQSDFVYMPVNGRHDIRLVDIKAREFPSLEDKSALEKKLMFLFDVIDVPVTDQQRATSSFFARPSMSPRSNLYKRLRAMDKAGQIPEIALSDVPAFEAYLDDLIGNIYSATVESKGKYNNVIDIFYIEHPAKYPTRDNWLVARKNSESLRAANAAVSKGTTPHFYEVPANLTDKSRGALIKYLTDNKATLDASLGYYVAYQPLEKAKKYEVLSYVPLANQVMDADEELF